MHNNKKICLNMIVKNEGKIIEQCLLSVVNQIDCYVICDTGSTDDSKKIIDRVMLEHDIPGKIYDIEFDNFSQARNDALAFAKKLELVYDYILLCDADLHLKIIDINWRTKLERPVYLIKQYNNSEYSNIRLLQREAIAEYRGVTHEYLNCVSSSNYFYGIEFFDRACGANRTAKFERDVVLLEKAIISEDDEFLLTRYHFYLAQTYFDLFFRYKYDNAIYYEYFKEQAMFNYKRRIEEGGWEEEVAYSYYRLGILEKHGNAQSINNQIIYFLKSYYINRKRIEALHELSKSLRKKGNIKLAYHYSTIAVAASKPPRSTLFVDRSVYYWKRFDELAVCAHLVGENNKAVSIFEGLLSNKYVPAIHNERIIKNIVKISTSIFNA